MCGFVVQFSFDGAPPDRERLAAMCADIEHRGPDGSGFFYRDWVGMGFRRLAILDPSSAADQPMVSRDGRYVLVYNGELYNFRELRQELEQAGIEFTSSGDTEVILEAFIRWGKDCPHRFIGMFAFVVLDLEKGVAFAARDHLGIKPLYFRRVGASLLLASEIKPFRHYAPFELNGNAYYEQLCFRYVPGRQTIFDDVFRLEPGCWMEIRRDGRVQETRYYDLTEKLAARPRAALDLGEVEAALEDSILRHTQSDVGYNIQLSGGVDSSYITAVLAGKLGTPLKTFSVTLKEGLDEGPYQRQVAEQFGTTHNSFAFDADDLESAYLRAAWHMDMPIVHVACPFLMLLCDRSRTDSKVILTGEGADEVFCGYQRFIIPPAEKLAGMVRRTGVPSGLVPGFWKFRGLKHLMARDAAVEAQRNGEPEIMEKILPEAARDLGYRRSIADRFTDPLDKRIALDQAGYLQSMLERQDRMSMAASVEARVPFCSRPVYELVNRIENAAKIRNGTTKAILKRLASKYFPEPFVHRRKSGFTLPLAAWLRSNGGMARFLDLLTDQTFRDRGIYDAAKVEALIREHRTGQRDRYKELFALINFEIWYRLFIDQSLSGATTRVIPRSVDNP
ncbi:MAG: asparagine synthase (glutamine-hydrolyzing) [Proteobacteria bacterium]|nr:asparagine synthase (glutamine-hydrolyzing) [Pseudomonadota bacterium]